MYLFRNLWHGLFDGRLLLAFCLHVFGVTRSLRCYRTFRKLIRKQNMRWIFSEHFYLVMKISVSWVFFGLTFQMYWVVHNACTEGKLLEPFAGSTQYVEMNNCGHLPMEEFPEDTLSHMHGFLASHGYRETLLSSKNESSQTLEANTANVWDSLHKQSGFMFDWVYCMSVRLNLLCVTSPLPFLSGVLLVHFTFLIVLRACRASWQPFCPCTQQPKYPQRVTTFHQTFPEKSIITQILHHATLHFGIGGPLEKLIDRARANSNQSWPYTMVKSTKMQSRFKRRWGERVCCW